MRLAADGSPRFVPAGTGGSFSTAFGYSLPDAAVRAVAVGDQGELYVGGEFRRLGGVVGANHVAMWNGTSWVAMGYGVNSTVHALVLHGDAVFVGGAFTTAFASGGDAVAGTNHVARWTGQDWTALGAGTENTVRALARHGTDLYVGGQFDSVYGSGGAGIPGTRGVARWNGSAWIALGRGAAAGGTVYALASTQGGVFVGGEFPGLYNAGSDSPVARTHHVARWNGAAWSALGGSTSDPVYALVASGADVYVGGLFQVVFTGSGAQVDGTRHVARWNGTAWSSLGAGVDNAVHALATDGTTLFVGGAFTAALAQDAVEVPGTRRIAAWNGSRWGSLGGGVEGSVSALAVSGERVIAGGGIDHAVSSGGTPVPATRYVAMWQRDDRAWSPLNPPGNGVVNTVHAIAVGDRGEVYVGGAFRDVGGVAGTSRVAMWDGVSWKALGGGAQGPVYALAVGNGGVYVGGAFAAVCDHAGQAGVPGTQSVARWDGVSWHALGGGVQGSVSALAVNETAVFVGGNFQTVLDPLGAPVSGTQHVAQWDGATWRAMGGGIQNVVAALALYNGHLIVGGSFESVYVRPQGASVPGTRYIASWDGASWRSLGGVVSGSVYALAATRATVHVGGSFGWVRNASGDILPGTEHVASWDGTNWHALGGGVQGIVFALAVEEGTGKLHVGGDFPSAGGYGADAVLGTQNVATWDGVAWRALAGAGHDARGGLDGAVHAMAVGHAEPAQGPNPEGEASADASMRRRGVPVRALFLGGDFVATNSGQAASRFTYFTSDDAATVAASTEARPSVRIVPVGPRHVRIESVTPGRVEVYDLLGRRIVATPTTAGMHDVSLEAMSAGVYVVRVQSGGQQVSRSVVIR